MNSSVNTPSLPNLVVIGAMKCGTTSLHDYLKIHPDIFMSEVKEIDFFSGGNSDKPLDWYRAQFDGAYKIRGESSQSYSKAHNPFHRGAPAVMAKIIPEARLIYIMRDPIERYQSHIVENYLGETADEVARNVAMDAYVETGLYHKQIQAFLEHYPLEQICFVDLDDLQSNRLATMNRIFEFLGLSTLDDPAAFDFRSNKNGEDILPQRLRNSRIVRVLNRLAPGLISAAAQHPAIRQRLFPGSLKASLGEDEIARLREVFAKDVKNLRALTGQSFAGWSV